MLKLQISNEKTIERMEELKLLYNIKTFTKFIDLLVEQEEKRQLHILNLKK